MIAYDRTYPLRWISVFAVYILAAYFSTIAVSVNAQPVNQITIASDDHPPLIQGDESPGKKPGVMTDIVKAAFKSQGIDVQYRLIPAARIAWSVLEDKVSAAVGPLGWFSEAQQSKVHSEFIFPATFRFFYLKSRFPKGFEYTRLEDLKDYRIGYLNGGAASSLLEKAGLIIQYVNDRDQNTEKVFLGRLDLMVTETTGGWESIKRLYPLQQKKFSISEQVILDAPGYAIFNKNQPQLIQRFQAGLDTIKSDGTFQILLNSYLGAT